MTLTEKYIEKVIHLNNAVDLIEHKLLRNRLDGWTQGVKDCGGKILWTRADNYYLNQGIDRPMCCGVWLDWAPQEKGKSND